MRLRFTMMRHETSVATVGGGFRVVLLVRASLDDPFEVLTHDALFASKPDAAALADKVSRRGEIDLAHWVWVPSAAAAFGFMKAVPTAVLSKAARPASAVAA